MLFAWKCKQGVSTRQCACVLWRIKKQANNQKNEYGLGTGVAENEKTCLAVHCGAKAIELKKEMTAAELDREADLLVTLETIKQAVDNGELDAQIEAMSGAVKND